MFGRLGVALTLCAVWLAPAAAATPRVVAGVKPIHSLVAGVMGEVGTPSLLITGFSSPHDYTMRPSDARMLEGADLVVWVGPSLESFLVRALPDHARSSRVLELDRAPGVKRLPIRVGGVFEADAHETEAANGIDGHLWLDPENGIAIVAAVQARLREIDPAHAETYARNAATLTAELTRLDGELAQKLAPVRGTPFIVVHDAYQYLERRYGLKAAGSVTLGVETSAYAQRIAKLRRRLREGGAVCVFAEPQFSPAILNVLVEGTDARVGVLDHLGLTLPAGPTLYGDMMRSLADTMTKCLAPSAR